LKKHPDFLHLAFLLLKLVHSAVVGAVIQVLVNLLNAHPTFLLQRPLLDESLEQSNSTGGEVGAEVGEGVGGGATGADVGALVGYR
jgi:hypothetical protein